MKDRGSVSFFDQETSLDLIRAYCNNIVVFIGEFKSLLKQLREGPLYRDFIQRGLILLKTIDEIEATHPIKYGSSRKSSASTPRSGESSPRPTADSPLMTNLSRLVSMLSPHKK